jgi:YD repeat-containing protein
LGTITAFHYDADGNCISKAVTGDTGAKNPDGTPVIGSLSSVSATYDVQGRMSSVKNNPLYQDTQVDFNPIFGDERTFVYDDAGDTTAITNGLGNAVTFGYDTAGRLGSVTDPKGNSSSYTYDANGNVLTTTSVNKSDLGNADLVITRTNTYDKLDRCTGTSGNTAGLTSYQYDSVGNLTGVTDALNHHTDYEYDENNCLKRTIWGIGGNISFSSIDRDANLRVTNSTDANGHTTAYSYDALDRPTGITFADGTTSSCIYDVHGNITSSTDQNGTTITNTYDLRNNIIHRDVAARNILVADSTTSERFAYDGLGRPVIAANDVSTNMFTYDALGRLMTENQDGWLLSHTYDNVGNRLSIAYPSGRKIVYSYDAANLCSSIGEQTVNSADGSIQTSLLSSNFYVGNLQEKITRKGGYTVIGYGINLGAQQLSRSVGHYSTGGSLGDVLIAGSVAQWDSTGNLSTRSNTLTGALQQYAYDELYRLTNTIVTSNSVLVRNTSYTLDANGNRLSVVGDNHPGTYTLDNSQDALTGEPGDAQMDQYTSTPIGDLQYDKNGNRIGLSASGVPQQVFVYDCFNRLVVFSNVVTGVSAYYGYDALGRRISKSIVNSGAPPDSTFSFFDGDGIIEQIDGAAALKTSIVHEMGHNLGMQHDPDGGAAHELGHNWGMQHDPSAGINLVTAQAVVPRSQMATLINLRTTGGSSNYWPLYDEQGSTIALSLDDGSVAESYAYADEGEPQFLDGNGNPLVGADGTTPATGSAVGNVFLFGGIEYDSETGLYAPEGSVLVDPATGATLQDDVGDAATNISGRDACNNHIRVGGENSVLTATPRRAGGRLVCMTTHL